VRKNPIRLDILISTLSQQKSVKGLLGWNDFWKFGQGIKNKGSIRKISIMVDVFKMNSSPTIHPRIIHFKHFSDNSSPTINPQTIHQLLTFRYGLMEKNRLRRSVDELSRD
jgi:hypothetical protein